MWFHREISAELQALVGSRPVTLVTGPRQTGKTALLRHLFPRFGYVSLDLPHLAEEAEADGERFLERHPPPHIFDEVQYAPRLLRFLKAAIDQSPSAGSYVLTVSAHADPSHRHVNRAH